MNSSNTPATLVAEHGTRPRTLNRFAATILTAALVGGATVALAAPASAAPTGTVTGGTFAWDVSSQLHLGVGNQTAASGALVNTDGIFTFVGGSGTVNTTTGASDVDYTGSARSAFINAGTEYYSITISDPSVEVDAAGNGLIRADVDTSVAGAPGSAPTLTSKDDVVVTRFTTDDGDNDTWNGTATAVALTDTPQWENVIAPGSADATDIGATDSAVPLLGKSFAKEFLLALPLSLRTHFYATRNASTGVETASNSRKNPGTFTANATLVAPTLTADVTSVNNQGVSISATGTGFRGVTVGGDAGVYIGLAPSGGIPSYVDTTAFVTAAFVPASAIVDGAISPTTLSAPASAFHPAKTYSLYTWQSHTHSNTSQDTETEVAIDFDDFSNVALSLAVSSSTTPYGKAVTAKATVPDATGDVQFFVGETAVGTSTLVDGVASVVLPKTTTVGAHSVSAKYLGSETLNAATSSELSVVVAKAKAVSMKIAGKSFKKKTAPTIRVLVGKLDNGAYPSGKVYLYVGTKMVKTVTVSAATTKKGAFSVKLPVLKKSARVKAVYAGTSTVASASSAIITITAK